MLNIQGLSLSPRESHKGDGSFFRCHSCQTLDSTFRAHVRCITPGFSRGLIFLALTRCSPAKALILHEIYHSYDVVLHVLQKQLVQILGASWTIAGSLVRPRYDEPLGKLYLGRILSAA